MAMKKHSKTKLYALILAFIIIDSALIVWVFIPKALPEAPGKVLKVLTRHDFSIKFYMEQAFLNSSQAKEHNISDINWITTSAESWPTDIQIYSPDIIFGGGPQTFNNLYNKGFLVKLNSNRMLAALERVNDTIGGANMKRFDDDGDVVWCASAFSTFGFTINKAWLSSHGLPFPTHWENLTSAEYGQFLPITPTISMRNSVGSTSCTRIYEIIIQKFGWVKGWEILTRMVGNSGNLTTSIELALLPVKNNNTGVAVSIDFYGYTAMLSNPNTEYRIPVNGSVINGDPIAICGTTSDQDAAEAFIDWVLSDDGQKQWLREEINRLPVLESAFQTGIGYNLEFLYEIYNETLANTYITFNVSLALSYELSLMYYFDAVLNDAQADLRHCWNKLVQAYLNMAISQAEFESFAAQLGAPLTWDSTTFTETYAISINSQLDSNPSFLTTIRNTWTDAAISRYNSLEALIP
ncbi:MAG: ABC transporter substrate-binding protein [Promethearchaeota archaeon]